MDQTPNKLKYIIYIIIILAVILGFNYILKIQKYNYENKINNQNETIKSLTYSMESFKEDYKTCLSNKNDLAISYQNQINTLQNQIDLYKNTCSNSLEQPVTIRIPSIGYYNGYYNNSFVTTYYCNQTSGTGTNLYYGIKMFGKKSCGYEQLFSRSGNINTNEIQRNCNGLWNAFIDANLNITKSLEC